MIKSWNYNQSFQKIINHWLRLRIDSKYNFLLLLPKKYLIVINDKTRRLG